MSKQAMTLVDICRDNAQTRAERFAYRFSDGDSFVASLSFAQLDQAARGVAGFLQSRCQPGDRVLLMVESGHDFVCAFFGCLYAGMVAVPLNLPSAPRQLATTAAIATSAGARLMLASDTARELVRSQNPPFECVDVADAIAGATLSRFAETKVVPTMPAFLQYTSGSTGRPKGVIVSHGNILANMAMIKRGFAHGDDCVGAGWLPLTHDMGLVGLVLQPAYLGIPSLLMRPMSFVRKPLRWLKLISENQVTTSGGPDFAYGMCVRRLDDADLEGIDLSSWRLAFNGAETIRRQTLDAFARKFARVGFSPRAFYPCYGLAEATLFVAGPEADSELSVRLVSAAALEEGVIPEREPAPDDQRVRAHVACGKPWGGAVVEIVEPETREILDARRVGEIWVAGDHVASGYWGDEQTTAEAFGAYTRDGQGPFLRTGDLGFVESGALYVTGRIKDVLIVSGKNHYPQDIEHTASQAHALLRGRPAAAFLVAEQEREVLVLIQEVPKTFSARSEQGARELPVRELKARICDAVVREHGLAVQHLLLVPQGALPMTTSGKIQRSLSRQLLLNKQFKEVEQEELAS